ncbi:MAG: 16S rRNA (guanine966-N2)-methyltransferase [Rhodothermales bacterium]|jgi:16S rRNA (guanine966-N2)-methyltransferase
MRIIAGIARGTRLHAPRDNSIRPTTDRVKEALLSSLEPLLDQVVVDLFSGSGAIGLEALSRGAQTAYLVDQDRHACKLIKRNLAAITPAFEEPPDAQIVPCDALRIPQFLAGVRPDIVFADAPYFSEGKRCPLAALLASAEFADWIGDGLLVLERSTHNPLLIPDTWQRLREKRFGDIRLIYLRRG